MSTPQATARRRSWALIIFGMALGLFGLVLMIGGVWLVRLGGSWYYIIAGTAASTISLPSSPTWSIGNLPTTT